MSESNFPKLLVFRFGVIRQKNSGQAARQLDGWMPLLVGMVTRPGNSFLQRELFSPVFFASPGVQASPNMSIESVAGAGFGSLDWLASSDSGFQNGSWLPFWFLPRRSMRPNGLVSSDSGFQNGPQGSSTIRYRYGRQSTMVNRSATQCRSGDLSPQPQFLLMSMSARRSPIA